jgi:hypothetical protein
MITSTTSVPFACSLSLSWRCLWTFGFPGVLGNRVFYDNLLPSFSRRPVTRDKGAF